MLIALLKLPCSFAPAAPAVPACRDIEDKPRFLVGVQVDVTDHPTEAQAAPVGMQAAGVVGAALQNMNWCVTPAVELPCIAFVCCQQA